VIRRFLDLFQSPSVASAITTPDRGFHFLQIGDRLIVAEHRAGLFTSRVAITTTGRFSSIKRVGAMLHLAGGISFGVNVGNFFQFQCAFERDRIMNSPPQKQKSHGLLISLGQIGRKPHRASGWFSSFAGMRGEFLHSQPAPARHSCCPQLAPEYMAKIYSAVSCPVKSFLVEATPISGPGMRINRALGLTRNHRPHHIANGQRLRSFGLSFALGGNRIRGFRPIAKSPA